MRPNQTARIACGIGYPATCYALPPETSRVRFQFVNGVIILLDATVNDKPLLLDTGTNNSLMDAHSVGFDG